MTCSVLNYCTNEFMYGDSIDAATTLEIVSITQTSASVSGRINADNGSEIYERGICYSTSATPTIANQKKVDLNYGLGDFACLLENLQPNTTYYARTYAVNNIGTAYGNILNFSTQPATLPIISATTEPFLITYSSAKSGGTIITDGASPVTARGVCWSTTNTTPTISNQKTIDGNGTGTFTSSITGLTANTTYYTRAYATNSIGTAYGNVVSFTTMQNLSVGQTYQGGIIAYLFQPGDSGYVSGQIHGLIATTSNQSTGYQWGCNNISIAGTSTTIGTGLNNTLVIVSNCTTSNTAANVCYNLVVGTYDDWFLPSKNELSKLYLNKSAIGGFTNASYWSSSQNNSTTAHSLNFSSGVSNTSVKTSSLYVRAIRKF